MKARETMSVSEVRRLGGEATSWAWRLAVAGTVGLLLAFALSLATRQGFARFLYAYLLNFCFFISLSLGALFFVMLQHLTRAGWSVVVRRLAEVLAAALPFWSLLFLPILLLVLAGSGSLYEWNSAAVVEHDELLQKKAPYLNAPFFAVRAVLYFAVWALLAGYYWRQSMAQDASGDKSHTLRMQKWSGPAMLAFALTLTFASFDWLMSLDPHWFSTIYGVYFFAGCAVGFFALLALMMVAFQQKGLLQDSITADHYHDVGKWLFGFVFFWGYIAFSQYMLIWYANIPEETTWYLARQSGGWAWISLLLLFGHFLVPFCGLMSRHAKRNKRVLAGWAGLLLVMHWIDIYWLVMPQFSDTGPTFGFVDAFCLVGMGGLYLAIVARLAADRELIAPRDPRLGESLAFRNA
jgi:hypothetical protein